MSVCVFVELSVALFFLFFHVYFLFVPIQMCSFLLLGAFTVSTKYGVFAFWSMDLMRKCACLFAEGDALSWNQGPGASWALTYSLSWIQGLGASWVLKFSLEVYMKCYELIVIRALMDHVPTVARRKHAYWFQCVHQGYVTSLYWLSFCWFYEISKICGEFGLMSLYEVWFG